MKAVRELFLSGLVIFMTTSTFAASNLYNFTLPNIDGKPMPLADFKGKVILMVNVASQCGYTLLNTVGWRRFTRSIRTMGL